jgi:peptidyl-dipeptidase Dcp
MPKQITMLATPWVITLIIVSATAGAGDAKFGPSNPFYGPSSLPFHAPPFDKIKDEDYQPAIEAGMAEELSEIQAIADNPAAPTFENTLVAMEKSGRLLQRSMAAFRGVTGANTNPLLQKVRTEEAPKLAAHQDAIYLNAKLFARVSAIYKLREALKLDPESLRLVEVTYENFVRAGANLSDSDKT